MTWLSDARHRFHLQSPSGLTSSGYTTAVTVPGSIRASGGAEVLKFGGPSAVGQYVIEIRYRSDVKAEWRLVDADDGRAFQIQSYADKDGAGRYLTIYALELQ